MLGNLLSKKTPTKSWSRRWDASGVVFSAERTEGGVVLKSDVEGFLTQLLDDGLALKDVGDFRIPWNQVYESLQIGGYEDFWKESQLPRWNESAPILRSSGSYSDADFSVALAGWRNSLGRAAEFERIGPVLITDDGPALMTRAQFNLVGAIGALSQRPRDLRNEESNRLEWGAIRRLALAADAHLDDFLYRSVVLTPEKLRIDMRRSTAVQDDRVVELIPGFDGAPSSWLEAFDSCAGVRRRYDLPTVDGIVQVMISDEARTVLEEIKRMPARRVAGSRAQAFILNPFATLGPSASKVIDEQQFEAARDDAGLQYERFVPQIKQDSTGYPEQVGILVESASLNGPISSSVHWFDDSQLAAFIRRLEGALDANHSLLAWEGHDFELSGEAGEYLSTLKGAASERASPRLLVRYAEVHDLSSYSERIEGIGAEKRYYSPYIAKRKEEQGWIPDNVLPMVVFQPDGETEPIAVPTTPEAIEKLHKELTAAVSSGKTEVAVPWLKSPLSLSDAKNIVDTFGAAFKAVQKGEFEPEKKKRSSDIPPRSKALILRANIQAVDYEERRQQALCNVPGTPVLPRALRPTVQLKEHQLQGLAWLQHLYQIRKNYQVRGAVLADDMGLGKTLQILALIAWLIDSMPDEGPALVVAPVSLLENWAAEAKRFFEDGSLTVLTAYGDGLSGLRVPRSQIDARLQSEDGLVKFLVPNWVGGARIVLTTYETLRDLEFSFAAQRWSVMVCDEAQKIKNPAAMVTRAAKKQNVGFKIACTGTPVENTLADLWCLFDYVQPGLLGALNDFGQRYRKPIEAKTDEERARVDELRERIKPQILRRLKSEVAKDLPKKIIDQSCRRLPLSAMQRTLYANAVTSFKSRGTPGHVSPFKNHLGLLHYLRLVCTDPKPHGLTAFKPEPVSSYRAKSPKLDWLLKTLQEIQGRKEKAIVFCEFREIQRLLRHYIELEFGYKADIINGDSSTSASHANSRQKRIDDFQRTAGFGVIILSPLAVGFGVNIQAANHVIHYTRTWNPAKEDQATDRAYRIGQTKDVLVYYPVVHADDFTTFEAKLDRLLDRKRALAEDMLNGAGDVMPGDFDVLEVMPPGEAASIDIEITLQHALQMEWKHFECLAGVLWNKQGYNCYRTPSAGDNGVDVVALSEGAGLLIQTKSASKDGQKLGWEAVKDVVTGAAFYQAQHPGIRFEKVCLTNQFFNDQAKRNAELNQVRLLEQGDLRALLEKHPVTMLEIEKMLYPEWAETT